MLPLLQKETFLGNADYSGNMEGVKAKSVWDRKREMQGNSQQEKAAAFVTKRYVAMNKTEFT